MRRSSLTAPSWRHSAFIEEPIEVMTTSKRASRVGPPGEDLRHQDHGRALIEHRIRSRRTNLNRWRFVDWLGFFDGDHDLSHRGLGNLWRGDGQGEV